MQEKAIDFEKDYLVIYKDVRGKFHSFRWFPSENLSPYEFEKLWDGINSKRGYPWRSNPWVWVIEFRRIEK